MKRIVLVILTFFILSFVFSQTVGLLVSDIQVQLSDDEQVVVSWQLPQLPENIDKNQASLLVFRTEEQKAGSNSLEGLSPLATLPFETLSYTDTPPRGKDFYYTVIINSENQTQLQLVIPDRNSTVVGIKIEPKHQLVEASPSSTIQEGLNTSTGLRNTPLPYLKLPLGESKDVSLNPERKQEISSTERLETKVKKVSLPSQYIFWQELESENVGEDFILQEIVNEHFKSEDYKKAEEALRDFLSINHSKEATDRGIFYLGEALLYQGKYQQALSCFLKVQDRFPDLSNRWIQAALDAYQLPATE